MAANQGDARALAWLSIFANRGLLAAASATQGFEWATRAASLHDLLGEYLLSLYYRQGYGTPVDERKAAQWATLVQSHSLGQTASAPAAPDQDLSLNDLEKMEQQLRASPTVQGVMGLFQLFSGALSGPDQETHDRLERDRHTQWSADWGRKFW